MVRKPTREELEDIFGTPRPSTQAISAWKASWREERGKVKVESYASAIKWLNEQDIPPLQYQFWYGESTEDGPYIVFYNPKHEVFFKMHNFSG